MAIHPVVATSAAADLSAIHLVRLLNSIDYTIPQLRKAIPPIYAIRRNLLILTGDGGGWGGRLLRFPERAQMSILTKAEFVSSVRSIRVADNDGSALFPFSL